MKLWAMTERVIDLIAELFGRIGWALLMYCMLLGITDVFLRYVMNTPSLWISTTVQVAMVLLACVGGVYALNGDAFVKLDLFYANFSARKRAFCDILTVGFTIMFLGALVWKGWQAGMLSLKMNQVTPTSIPIPIYPLKIFIPISGVVMILVVFKKLVNDVLTLIQDEAPAGVE